MNFKHKWEKNLSKPNEGKITRVTDLSLDILTEHIHRPVLEHFNAHAWKK